MDLSLIKKDIINIINNNNKHSNIIVLYSLGILELFIYIKETGFINNKFIKYLSIINKEFKFKNKIDYNYLKDLVKNKKVVKITSLSPDSESSGDICYKINSMLKKDSKTVKQIINKSKNELKIDEYGKISDSLIKSAKSFFKKFDKDKDGLISAIEAIRIYEIDKKNSFCFNCNIEETLVTLLINNNYKIDFNNFFINMFL